MSGLVLRNLDGKAGTTVKGFDVCGLQYHGCRGKSLDHVLHIITSRVEYGVLRSGSVYGVMDRLTASLLR